MSDCGITTVPCYDLASSPHYKLLRHDSAISQTPSWHNISTSPEQDFESTKGTGYLELQSTRKLATPVPQQQEQPEVYTSHSTSFTTTAQEPWMCIIATTQVNKPICARIISGGSTSTDIKYHSVVRGFERGHDPGSIQSGTNLDPTSTLEIYYSFPACTQPPNIDLGKKRQPMLTLGSSSDEDAANSLTLDIRTPSMQKTTSFKNEASTRTYQETIFRREGALESDNEDDVVDSTIEEDSDWKDDDNDEESGAIGPEESGMFARVESRSNLVPLRSLLTTALHQGDCAPALQTEVSRSTSTT
jgi:hypothetical protein